ncbi:hypothetical protein P12x_004281 [Tundrisphaera lichenicola]|uniref:hypothetical protein n=1 Tax=Tundrisphaera lichenicola TaxID=2029860 RepID=UPI003EBADE03
MGWTLLAWNDWALADDYYFVMIFGSQSRPKLLRYTHTWATFVKATGEGPDLANYALETHTISWLPASLRVRTFAPRAETGVNLGLDETIDYVLKNGENVNLWGPFIVRPEIWDRSLRIHQILDSGQAEYRAISTSRDLLISDCIHAVAAVDPVFGRNHYPLIRVGKPASRYIARQIMTRSTFDQCAFDQSWLIPRLGLSRYPIEVIPPRVIPKESCLLCRHPD